MTREEQKQARAFLEQRVSLETAKLGLRILDALKEAEGLAQRMGDRAWTAEDRVRALERNLREIAASTSDAAGLRALARAALAAKPGGES